MLRLRVLVGWILGAAFFFLGGTSAQAQAVKPWFLIVVDTSASMGTPLSPNIANSCAFTPTDRLHAAKCAINNIVNSTGDAEFGLMQFSQSGCGTGTCDTSAASGQLRVGISDDPSGLLALVDDQGSEPNNEICAGAYTPLGGSLRAAQAYFEGGSSPTINDDAVGCRPINIILLTDGEERCQSCNSSWSDCPDFEAAFPGQSCLNCNSGGTGFFESAPEAAYDLLSSVVPTGGTPSTQTVSINTYVIGFGITSGNARIERIALGGGTDNPSDGPGGLRGFYAADEAQLSAALAQIIFDSQLNEVCNGVDDDCDEKIDEGHVTYCDLDGVRSANPSVPHPTTGVATDQALVPGSNLAELGGACTYPAGCSPDRDTPACCGVVPGLVGEPLCASTDYTEKLTCESLPGCSADGVITCMTPPNILCDNPGELCDGVDNNCNGLIDEPPIVGTRPSEECDNEDDDCDGIIDEDCVECQPTEQCNNKDDDCDGLTDENLRRPCGYNLGICRAGEEECIAGNWVVDPDNACILPEASDPCDGEDDDCDGSTDEDAPTQSCDSDGHGGVGECELGVRSCDPDSPDLFGPCEGEVRPATEVCDGRDNDCDGYTDEAPGSMVNGTLSRRCGTDVGICSEGDEFCTDGGNPDPNARYNNCDATSGGTEVCNRDPNDADQSQYDEDCDGRIDESDSRIGDPCSVDQDGNAELPPGAEAGVGICVAGQAACFRGEIICPNYQGPGTEVCDDVDQNCNGDNIDGVGPTWSNPGAGTGTDLRLGAPCGFDPDDYSATFPDALVGIGECNLGTLVCDDRVVGSEDIVCAGFGVPMDETCNGLDDDCDGSTDEDVFPDDPSSDCQTGVNAGPYPYDPPREFCGRCTSTLGARIVCTENLLDDDPDNPKTCDTLGYGTASAFGGEADCCGNYQFTSNWDFGNLVGPHNGVNECQLGRFLCLAGAPVCANEITPGDEICDGLDNDCDDATDELAPGIGQPCGTDVGICMRGAYACTGTDGLQCMNQYDGLDDELCNGLDDDCDGFVDEGNPEGGAACGGGTCRIDVDGDGVASDPDDLPCGTCQYGIETCQTQLDDMDQPIGGTLVCVGSVEPADEVCDGRDNDCDSHCRFDTSVPPQQICDPLCDLPDTDPDYEDCDAKIDEDVSAETDDRIGTECGDDTGECDFGENVCMDGALVCQGGVGPVDEVCNGRDDDCDGIADDGIPVGAPCGTDEGECRPGMQVCDTEQGILICQGEVGPIEEVCDALDNDCDGNVDEDLGVGEACGSDVGTCMTGVVQCVNGRSICVGEVTPTIETCDCEDNDCDGNVDEDVGDNPLCPGGSACVMCQCALPCADPSEFAVRCPEGKAPVETDDGCYCVGEQCNSLECEADTIERDGETLCAPDSDVVGTCRCKNNECSFACSGVVCTEGLVCDPTDGRCKQMSCLLPQFACAESERCQRTDDEWTCVEDPCADAECDEGEACRDGECVRSCARIECDLGSRCEDGNCVVDRCYGVQCQPGQLCNPEDGECATLPAGGCFGQGCPEGEVCEPIGGECVSDVCLVTRCPFAETCDSETGQCTSRCGSGFLWCGDECADPMTSRTHCGATEPCTGDKAGEICEGSQVCSRGECSDECAGGLVNCNGECIDPQSDRRFCGASGDCEGDNDGDVCGGDLVCRAGACANLRQEEERQELIENATRVIASGGGGCTCSVPGSAPDEPGGKRGPLSLLLFGFGLVALLGRRRGVLRLARALLGSSWVWLVVLALFAGAGCDVDTFCVDCPGEGTANVTGQGDGENPNFGSADGGTYVPDASGGGQRTDAAPMNRPDGSTDGQTVLPDGNTVECTEIELCNGFDDDCDGTVDEDVDPSAQNIDLATNPNHCGACGNACAIEHAFSVCVDSECHIDRDADNGGCDIGFHDLDGDESNGCEYRCVKTADEDSVCDLVDNDCDGETDEDLDLDTDTENCGRCGVQCRFRNAAEGGSCVDGACVLDDTRCDDGYTNLDGRATNGCEFECPIFPTTDELCNLRDDDCDGIADEGVADSDSRVDTACRTDADGMVMLDPGAAQGICQNGTSACVNGTIACMGEARPTTEGCNGDDDDCDGKTDESDRLLGTECGSSVGVCRPGERLCVDGNLICGGTNRVEAADLETCNGLDDDCDGLIDEHIDGVPIDVGSPCTTRTGSLVINPTMPPEVGACHYGTAACRNGSLVCEGEVIPRPEGELCDNTDHDCDGNLVNGVAVTDDEVGNTCGNQLGICQPGVTECVDRDPGTAEDWAVQCSPGSVEPDPNGETCNGLDDDCDGSFDEYNNDGADPPLGTGGPCHLAQIDSDPALDYVDGPIDPGATGECVSGVSVCSNGTPACAGYEGPKPEVCDGLDNDCNGIIDDNTALEGLPCNHLTGDPMGPTWPLAGECTQGTWTCPAPSGPTNELVCSGGTRPAAEEICDGLDNDCDGLTDNAWVPSGGPADGDACCPTGYTCTPGSTHCDQGAYRCQGDSGVVCVADINPVPEVCDGEDNNCNGATDEGFSFTDDKLNCGGCNIDCDDPSTMGYVADAIMICESGTCKKLQCRPGFFDDQSTPEDDCSHECTIQGEESCNGEDDDCDGLYDEDDPDWQAPQDETFCNQIGECANNTAFCNKTANEWQCTNTPAASDTCDGLDNDCDGRTDEDVGIKAGHSAPPGSSEGDPCRGPGEGYCSLTGVLVCDPTNSNQYYCVNNLTDRTELVARPTPGSESLCLVDENDPGGPTYDCRCDNKDNDCDGQVDERCDCDPNDGGCTEDPDNCVWDDWAELPSGGYIFEYEASRPDSTATSQGGANEQNGATAPACSRPERMPWTNVSYADALAHCQAIHPDATLCSRTQWRDACDCGSEGTTGSAPDYDYGWSYPSCGAYSSMTCNDTNYAGTDAVVAGGTATGCYRPLTGGSVFDLSGNVKELTLKEDPMGATCAADDPDPTCSIMVRGGAMNNTAAGTACGFERSFWPDDAPFHNVGFRCCMP